MTRQANGVKAARGKGVGDLSHNSLVDRGFSRFVAAYNRPGFDFNVNLARVFVCAFLIWKLLGRDWGFFGRVPEEVFYFYPINLYPRESWVLWTGLPVVQDLVTFHWVHWFLPHPGETMLRGIQALAIGSLFVLAIFGRGPRRAFLIIAYSLLIYLWAYLFLLGQDIDAIDLYFGMLIALGIGAYSDEPIWRLAALYQRPKTVEGGQGYSNLMLVFVFYYFASGVKKLTDLSPLEWFRYDLIEAIEEHTIRAAHSTFATLDIFKYLHGLTFLDYIGPPLVYVSHLLVLTVFFRRSLVLKFFIFYFIFHLLTFGVGISFTGYIFVWAVLFPYREMLAWLRGRLRLSASETRAAGGQP